MNPHLAFYMVSLWYLRNVTVKNDKALLKKSITAANIYMFIIKANLPIDPEFSFKIKF